MKKNKRDKKRSSSISKPTFADIPEDIIIRIFTFLPVKTLIRFRRVSQFWFNLISTPKFIKTHLSNSNNQRLILRYIHDRHHLDSCSFSSRLSVGFCKAVHVHYPTKKTVSLVGACNGLLCIAIQDFGLLILNICTRISRKVPVLDIKFEFGRTNIVTNCGFGYDVVTGDYKVVWVVSVLYGNAEKEVKIYSLKTGLWRKIGEFPFGIPSNDWGKFVNGVLHWTVNDFDSSMVIVTLDLGSETYGQIAQPCYGDRKISAFNLGVLKGRLSVFCHFEKMCCDIWIMKEYGVRDTWIKSYTIPYDSKKEFSCYSPLCICKSGEILLEFGWRLYLYNPSNGKLRNANIRNLPGTLTGLESITYVESLISPISLL